MCPKRILASRAAMIPLNLTLYRPPIDATDGPCFLAIPEPRETKWQIPMTQLLSGTSVPKHHQTDLSRKIMTKKRKTIWRPMLFVKQTWNSTIPRWISGSSSSISRERWPYIRTDSSLLGPCSKRGIGRLSHWSLASGETSTKEAIS